MSMGGTDMNTSMGSDAAGNANGILDRALQQAIPYAERFTQSAIDEQKREYTQSRYDTKVGQAKSEALMAPYQQSGYAAFDRYSDAAGIPRFEMGSGKIADALDAYKKTELAAGHMYDTTGALGLNSPMLTPIDQSLVLQA